MSQKSPDPLIPRPPPDPREEAIANAAIDEMLAAYRRGDLDAMRVLSAALHGPPEEASAPLAPAPAPKPPPSVPLAIRERAARERQELEAMDPEAGADERLLLRLVGDSLPTVMVLDDVVEHLAVHLPGLLDRPGTLKIVASAMHDALSLRNVTLNRLQGVLTTVASLRAQRRFVQRRGGQNGV